MITVKRTPHLHRIAHGLESILIAIPGILLLALPALAGTPALPVIPPPSYETAAPPNRTDVSPVSIAGQNGSITVPSAIIEPGSVSAAIYNTYASQNNLLGWGSTVKNDTVAGAFSYAPVRYLDLSIGTLNSTSGLSGSQSLRYSGDLRIGMKAGVRLLPHFSIAGLGEVLTYSKANSTGTAGYNGNATSYTLSLLATYDLQDSAASFPLIINLRAGYLWDNTGKLLNADEAHFIPPAGKYAMGIRGDNQTLVGCSLLFPLPRYFIEPLLEFTAQFAGAYRSYAVTDPSFARVSFAQNPVYLTPGIMLYTPVRGLRIALAASLSLARRLNGTTGPAPVTPQTVWITGLSYSL